MLQDKAEGSIVVIDDVNYENIASDCQVSAKTVKEYFGILSDTLIGYTQNRKKLSYWHTYNGKEVDAVIGEAEIGVEIWMTFCRCVAVFVAKFCV